MAFQVVDGVKLVRQVSGVVDPDATRQRAYLYRAESRDAACELLFWGRFRLLGGIR
jgi:hypothetical protein